MLRVQTSLNKLITCTCSYKMRNMISQQAWTSSCKKVSSSVQVFQVHFDAYTLFNTKWWSKLCPIMLLIFYYITSLHLGWNIICALKFSVARMILHHLLIYLMKLQTNYIVLLMKQNKIRSSTPHQKHLQSDQLRLISHPQT